MNNEPVTLTVQRGTTSLTITLPWDANADELAQAFRTIMYHLDFSIETVAEIIPNDG